jgi:hypothetical protein
MRPVNLEFVTEQLQLGEDLLAKKGTMFQPQDLPGRYGRVVKSIDHILEAISCPALVAGGWAVWNYGFFGRMTQDIDIVLPADRIDDFLCASAVSGFEILAQPEGRWPKIRHKDTDIEVDILPEGGRPGTPKRPAPTTIRSPVDMGAVGSLLRYISLPALIELKLAAGRGRDESDVIELVRANSTQAPAIRQHLVNVHRFYAEEFDRLCDRARDQQDK